MVDYHDLFLSGRLMVGGRGILHSLDLACGLRFCGSELWRWNVQCISSLVSICHKTIRSLGKEIIFCSLPRSDKFLCYFCFVCFLCLNQSRILGPSSFTVHPLEANKFAPTFPWVSPYLCFGLLVVISSPSQSAGLVLLVSSSKLAVGPRVFPTPLSESHGLASIPPSMPVSLCCSPYVWWREVFLPFF